MKNHSPDPLSPNKQALLKIRQLKQQLAEAEQGKSDDIAIVSMACRFPRRSSTPEKFWESLLEGRDEVTDVPPGRWELDAFYDEDPEAPGRMYARRGVFLDQIDEMDPEFFGISPREATWIDPQQRLLLEVGWEALERAGWVPERIAEQTGVFVGWMHNDYQNEASDSFLNLNPYIATGAAGSFLCGRLAYYLGLQGPSVAVDTACSSSLVALHLACQSLQRRDCDRALVGGVNTIISPTTNILTCKLKALSPHGHSRAFDAAADGYLRGEGCGVVTVRRLADAERDGDPILGVIRGSAVGHNGFSSGLTAPNPRAQERVIRQALDRAGLVASDVQYLEAHGTGTELGDPIEMQAAAAALGGDRDRARNPLLVGSVKTNIGHLEAAAGMAGLIKVLLALQHDWIPAQLNFETPNPHIAWDQLPVEVVAAGRAWPTAERRVAGVSAFGMSGTNAHIVVEQPPRRTATFGGPSGRRAASNVDALAADDTAGAPGSVAEPTVLLPLSGKSADGLRQLAGRYGEWLKREPSLALSDVAANAGQGRSHFEYRAAIVAGDREETVAALDRLARGGTAANLFTGNERVAPRVAWQFTGQGSQYPGMARGLYESETVFRETLDQCDGWMQEIAGESLNALLSDDDSTRIHDTRWTQPALFAIQMGLARLLESWGLRPDAVLGHSVGQYAAACVAGVMSWEDGFRLISERGRLIGELPAGGGMMAIFAAPTDVKQWIAGEEELSLAALNGAHQVVSGREAALDALQERLTEQGIRCRPLTTSHAFHSHLMEPALGPFRGAASQFEFLPARIPLICNVSGELLPADRVLDGSYWADHIRQPVRYAEGVAAARNLGCEVLVELGPRSVLTRMAAAAWQGPTGGLIETLTGDIPDRRALIAAVGRLFTLGANPDFRKLDGDRVRPRLLLPTYPFQRRRFWGPAKPRALHSEFHTAHPLLGQPCHLAGVPHQSRYESVVEPDSPAWLPDHRVMGQPVLPGAALVEIGLAAGRGVPLVEVAFEQPLQPQGRTTLQTVVHEVPDESTRLEVYSSPEGENQWVRHLRGQFGQPTSSVPPAMDLESVAGRCPREFTAAEFYARMEGLGLEYGPEFQVIQSLRCSEREVLAELKLRGDIRGFAIAPPLLDGALHCLAVGLLAGEEQDLFLPVGIGRFELFAQPGDSCWVLAEWVQPEGDLRTANVTLLDANGQVLAQLDQLQVRRLTRAALRQIGGGSAGRLLTELRWRETGLPVPDETGHHWLMVSSSFGDEDGLATCLARELETRGQRVTRCRPDGTLASTKEFEGDEGDSAWSKWVADWTDETLPEGVVWIPDSRETNSSEAGLAGTARQIQGWLDFCSAFRAAGGQRLECGFQWVTERGVAVPGADDDPEALTEVTPDQAQYWGLGRVLGAEHPEYRCRILDVGPSAEDRKNLVETLLGETRDNQFAFQQGRCWVPRLVPLSGGKTPQPLEVDPDGAYLVTGGLGKLGLRAAAWLADRGARQVVLVSRRAPDALTEERIKELRSTGCDVVVHGGDVSRESDVAALMDGFGQQWAPLKGVIHAAGVLDDGLLIDQTWERFAKVLAPKVVAGRWLDRATRDRDLDFFVLYSSAASVLGSPGQSNYALANAWLDGLAWSRRAAGLPALALNWGPWTEGMADDEKILKRLSLQGITPLTAGEAHGAMEQALAANVTQGLVMDVDWRRLRVGMGSESLTLLEELTPAAAVSRGGDSALVAELRKLAADARREKMVGTIQAELQTILSTPELPETGRPLIEMGLDSLMAVEFGTRLQQLLGDEFPVAPTMLFEYPTIDAISDHVLELVGGATGADPSEGAVDEREPARQAVIEDDIAIVGISCRFPGAEDVEQFWNNLLEGVDAVGEIPGDRWDVDAFYSPQPEPGKMISRQGGFVENIGDFDAELFGISPQEACWMDPQHRLLLENSWRALEDAGIPDPARVDPRVGVFMGIMSSDYAFLPSLDDPSVVEAFQGAGLSHSAGVGRISYFFGLEGPSVAVDTASSSSLVAVCQAMRSLQDGECNVALAGGVNAILAPVNSLLMSRAGMLAPDGRCKSFSAEANGFGRGEGCGVVVLKRLQDARRDGDRVYAVLRGGAVSHNGTSGGLTAPSGRAQSRLIGDALARAGVAPHQVQYLEAHGTGTEYGDPMELGAAAAVYGKGRQEPLLVGSVKANLSHLEAAGGISGLIKTALAIHHGVIPRQLHFENPSPHVPWDRLPVRMVTENTPWPEVEERMAAVTALGLSGTNAHVLLSEPPREPAKTEMEADSIESAERSCHLLAISARDSQGLNELIESYRGYLARHPNTPLADLCFSATTGRRGFPRRAAVVADSVGQLAARLEQLHRSAGETGAGETNGQAASSERQSEPGTWIVGGGLGGSDTPPRVAWTMGASDPDGLTRLPELYRGEPVVRRVIDQLESRWREHEGSLQRETAPWVDGVAPDPEVALFSLQIGLARLWQSWGMEPDVLWGVGVGQYTAACLAGGMEAADAVVLVAERARWRREWGTAATDSAAAEAALDAFEALADRCNYFPPDRPLICSLTGETVPIHKLLGGSYWRRQVNDLPDVEAGWLALQEAKCDLRLHLGSDLGHHAADRNGKRGGEGGGHHLTSLDPQRTPAESLQEALACLYVAGANPDFAGLHQHRKRHRIAAPHYPFQRKRYWITELDKFAEPALAQSGPAGRRDQEGFWKGTEAP